MNDIHEIKHESYVSDNNLFSEASTETSAAEAEGGTDKGT